jgi:hypothetical protein
MANVKGRTVRVQPDVSAALSKLQREWNLPSVSKVVARLLAESQLTKG